MGLAAYKYSVYLVKEEKFKYYHKVSSAEEVYNILSPIIVPLDREYMFVIMLDTKNNIIGFNTVAIGILNAIQVHPREIFKPAFLCNAAAIILAHNHPSGDITHSSADINCCTRLKEAGDVLGVPLMDFIIMSDSTYISFNDLNLIKR